MLIENFWLAPKGEIIDARRGHVQSFCSYFDLPFEEHRSMSYYDKAFSQGFIRICICNGDVTVQLESPADNKQRKKITEFLDKYGSVLVIFKQTEGRVLSEGEMGRALSGNNPFVHR
jgi:hypothetical protein